MTLCRRDTVYLNQKNGRFVIEHKHGSITVTCKIKANRLFDKMTLSQ